MSRFRMRAGAVAAVLAVALPVTLPASALAAAPLPTPVTAGGMPTPQVDGIVFSVAIVGNTVYAGGRFTKARPSGVAPGGAGEVDRHNLLAFDLTTGALLPWAPDVSGTTYTSSSNPGPFCKTVGTNTYDCDTVFRIKASPDGSKVYVGGDFDQISGQWRSRLAAFSTADGSLDPTFKPTVAGRVRGISVTADTVYVGGGFNAVNGVARTRLAAIGLDGTLLPWAPTADGEVFAVTAAPPQGRVLIGGNFGKLDGSTHASVGSVDATSGVIEPWNPLPGNGSVVTDIVTDGNGTAYLGAYNYIPNSNPRFEGRAAVDIASGVAKWYDGCYGDTQSVTVTNGILYSGSHSHDCSALTDGFTQSSAYYRLIGETAAATGTSAITYNHVHAGDPMPTMLPWYPNTNGGPSDSYWKNGPWALDSNSQYVVVGGEFTEVNGKPQQGLTRFAARGVSGAVNNGPQTPFKAPVLTKNAGNPVITWSSTWDAQNPAVTYQVFRIGTSGPIYSVSQQSRPWNTPTLTYTDRSVTGGTYYIRAVDADGAAIGSPQATI